MGRAMKDSGVEWIGEIPEDWEIICFKHLNVGMNTGEGIDKEYWSNNENDMVFYTAGLLPIYTTYQDFPAWKYTCENDLLLARNGTPYVYLPACNACYTDHIIRVTLKKDANRRFVRYGLQQSISSVVINQVSIATWSASLWNEQVLPSPPLSDQQIIADFLDYKCSEIDAVLNKTRASIEEYKHLKQAVITQAVTKGVRGDRPMKESGIDWIGEIPADWQTYRVAHWYEERNEAGCDELPVLMVSIHSGVSDDVVRDEDRNRKSMQSEDKTKYKRVYPGDLVYNMMRAWQGAFGAVRVEGLVSPAYVVAKPKQHLDTRYIEALFRTPAAIEEMRRYSYGVADFRLRLYWQYFKNIRFCLPSLEEQKEIADFIDVRSAEIDTLITKKEQLLTELENYKKSLIYEYVTGKREVSR